MAKLDLTGRLLAVRTRNAQAFVAAVEAGLATVELPVGTVRSIKSGIADELMKVTVPDDPPGRA